MYAYRTVKANAEFVFEVKRSVFYAAACHAESAEEAMAYLRQRAREHPKATHHCYAFALGPSRAVARSSDAGEPAGTAGRPILAAMEAKNVSDAAIVVTRYFGGSKLGAAGLARAYSRASAGALDEATLVPMEKRAFVEALIPYGRLEGAKRYLASRSARIRSEEFGEAVKVLFSVREKDANSVSEYLERHEMARGCAAIGVCYEPSGGETC
ncbi:MAG: IMPACT family protein [Eubacteriaceae bacterium]|jgi:uncharacterized YigZ family protein|nr:IMPACT family protein [Eubacteriaceae bacterium]